MGLDLSGEGWSSKLSGGKVKTMEREIMKRLAT